MANLIVRNIDESIVDALKARAGKHGRSAEAEHRRILEAALSKPTKRSLIDILKSIPEVGEDSDFQRINDDRGDRDVFN
ncbi:DNA-binding protein [uncultured Endozoicomonas sp.]|uniref:FitA-like ribbon-helix-helix domain-containing protein n=1 Tax=uncultured Endozoicomonas sp. TaxID=432652 RepID=UPI002617D847|nr:DNA-binding protein [uncultured Endozoicomonas sp.]